MSRAHTFVASGMRSCGFRGSLERVPVQPRSGGADLLESGGPAYRAEMRAPASRYNEALERCKCHTVRAWYVDSLLKNYLSAQSRNHSHIQALICLISCFCSPIICEQEDFNSE